MEAFSLLKYWRGGSCETRAAPPSTNLLTAMAHNPSSSPSSLSASCDDNDETCDDGPFFDLEFEEDHNGFDFEHHQIQELEQDEEDELLEDEGDETNNHKYDNDDEVSRHFNFTLSTSSGSSNDNDNDNDNDNNNISVCSPSDDIFFKGRFVPIETTSTLVLSESNNKPHQVPSFLLRSATKFRVLSLGSFKKPPKGKTESKHENDTNTKPSTNNNNSKFLIVSLFTRDNSSKGSGNNSDNNAAGEGGNSNNDKKFSKEAMQRYLKKVNQVYVRVSKRNNASNGENNNNNKSVKSNGNNLSLNLNMNKNLNFPVMACKHLGKSRSASSSVVVAAPPRGEAVVASRRDDSLFQQQDGIQSAILHCKRSFNASSDSEKSILARSVSDPLQEKCIDLSRKSADDEKKVGDTVRKCGKVEQ